MHILKIVLLLANIALKSERIYINIPNTHTMKKILLIEENRVIADSLKFLMEHTGYNVQLAHDGETALDMLNENQFDLTVMELTLPLINGKELVNMFSENYKLKESANKVFILSANANEETMSQMFEMNVDDYLTKPFSSTEFLVRVKKLLN